ncbi:tyrosine-type recombinase/integrase [Bradyrhizobium sp. Pa8]|uniref:tyrosine-type recombinase/integrase n=1 Tax=Bradyrhizobium sp. Pa8 TaxID=3386552 RepID=UPI00403EF701
MPVFITDDHLKTPAKGTKTYSDGGPKGQKGFVLRATANGAFSLYYQYLNKKKLHPKTKKPVRDWELIGTVKDGWTIARARAEAARLAALIALGKDIRQIAAQQLADQRAMGVTFRQVHDEYIAYCSQLVDRKWGRVPRKETWPNIQSALKRPLEWWGDKVASEITPRDVKELYDSIVAEGYPAQANNVRGQLGTLFIWAMHEERQYVSKSPVVKQLEDDKVAEKADLEEGRVLDIEELRRFWFGLNDPDCPGSRLSKLALKLSLVTLLRTGECVKIERELVGPKTVTIPLKNVKSRKAKKARPVVQPLNSLAQEILGEAFSIGDAKRDYAFPGTRKRRAAPMSQQSLGALLRRTTDDANGHMGVCEYLCLEDVTPHDLRRTGATILSELGYTDAEIGRVMTHKAADDDAAPVTRERYIVSRRVLTMRPVIDRRVDMLNHLDLVLREELGLPAAAALPAPQQLLSAA